MHRPVLVTPADLMPLTVAEVKAHLRVAHDDDDATIAALIAAATAHLDGWTGILGRCLVEQTWMQEFDRFERCLRLPLGPVGSITSVKYYDEAGVLQTVGSSNYSLFADGLGFYVRFVDGFAAPALYREPASVRVSYKAGQAVIETDGVMDGVEPSIKFAMLLLIGHWYENREAVALPRVGAQAAIVLPFAVDALLAPHRRR